MDLLEKAKQFGGNLLDFVVDYGQRRYSPEQPNAMAQELATDPGVLAAQRAYDRNYRISRGEAIRKGARWYEMDDYGRAGAEQQYGRDLMGAFQQAEALKQVRDRSARERGIRGLLGELELTPSQRGYLDAAGPEAAQEILAKHLFPSLSGKNGATPGTIGTTKVDRAGNVWTQVQTGDPNEPVKWVRADGFTVDERPAALRSAEGFYEDPRYTEGMRKLKFAERYGAEAAAVQTKAEAEVPSAVMQASKARARLEALRDRVAKIETGRFVGPLQENYKAELQAINSEFNMLGLKNIGTLNQEGIRLNPISEHELKILFSTAPTIANEPAANVEILNRMIGELDNIISNGTALIGHIDSGLPVLSYRPRFVQAGAGVQQPGAGGGVQPQPPPGTIPIPGASR